MPGLPFDTLPVGVYTPGSERLSPKLQDC